MTHDTERDDADDAERDASAGGDPGDGLTTRLARADSAVERRPGRIEACSTHGDGEGRTGGPAADGGEYSSLTRRGLLTAGGLVTLLGLGARPTAADPQGQVGTSSDPLTGVYTREVNAGADGSLVFTADGARVLSLGRESAGNAGNVVAGHPENRVADEVVGATIAGGGFEAGVVDEQNEVVGDYGVIGGGKANRVGTADPDLRAGDSATVGGGEFNDASGFASTISGGVSNTAAGLASSVGGGGNNAAAGFYATISGGSDNVASGRWATVAGGEDGRAADDHAFVWNDGSEYHDFDDDGSAEGLSSARDVAGSTVTGANTFHASAQGGFRFVTGPSSVTFISGGSTGWATTSTRTAKTAFEPVDTGAILDGVAGMELGTWEYRDDDGDGCGERHIGPVAEEFHEVVDVGTSDDHINSINADGVLFAAVQGLVDRLADQRDRIGNQQDRIDELEATVDELEATADERSGRIDELAARNDGLAAENERLRERNDALEERLAAVEERLAGLEDERSVTAPEDG